MRRLTELLAPVAVLLALAAPPAQAQATAVSTTLSGGGKCLYVLFNITNWTGAACTIHASAEGVVYFVHWKGTQTITAVNHCTGGVSQAMTAASGSPPGSGDDHHVMAYYVGPTLPSTGACTPNVQFSAQTGAVVFIRAYSNLDDVTPFTGWVGEATTSEATQLEIQATSVTANDIVLDGVTVNFNAAAMTDDASPSVEDYNADARETTIGYLGAAGSHETGTGTVEAAWTYTGNITHAHGVLVVKGSAAGGGGSGLPPNGLSLVGAGR